MYDLRLSSASGDDSDMALSSHVRRAQQADPSGGGREPRLDRIDGLAVSPDGTRLFVAYRPGLTGRIDELSIPDAQLTAGIEFEINWGTFPTGMVVDGDNHVLYQTTDGVNVTIDVYAP